MMELIKPEIIFALYVAILSLAVVVCAASNSMARARQIERLREQSRRQSEHIACLTKYIAEHNMQDAIELMDVQPLSSQIPYSNNPPRPPQKPRENPESLN